MMEQQRLLISLLILLLFCLFLTAQFSVDVFEREAIVILRLMSTTALRELQTVI